MSEAAIVLVARWTLALVFLASSGGKLASFHSFTLGVASYRLVPRRWAPAIAGIVTVAEIALAAALVTGTLLRAAAAGALALSVGFAIAITVNLARGSRVACHCFGDEGEIERISAFSLARSVAMIGLASAVAISGEPTPPASFGFSIAVGYMTVAMGLFVILRLVGLLPAAIEFMKATARVRPKPSRRVTYSYHDPESRLALLRRPTPHFVEAPGLSIGAADE